MPRQYQEQRSRHRRAVTTRTTTTRSRQLARPLLRAQAAHGGSLALQPARPHGARPLRVRRRFLVRVSRNARARRRRVAVAGGVVGKRRRRWWRRRRRDASPAAAAARHRRARARARHQPRRALPRDPRAANPATRRGEMRCDFGGDISMRASLQLEMYISLRYDIYRVLSSSDGDAAAWMQTRVRARVRAYLEARSAGPQGPTHPPPARRPRAPSVWDRLMSCR